MTMEKFVILLLLICSETIHAEEVDLWSSYKKMASALIDLRTLQDAEIFHALLKNQPIWMESARGDCDAQSTGIGSSSSRNYLYINCMSEQYLNRQTYLRSFICPDSLQIGKECSNGSAPSHLYDKKITDNASFMNTLHGFVIDDGKINAEQTDALLDNFTAGSLSKAIESYSIDPKITADLAGALFERKNSLEH